MSIRVSGWSTLLLPAWFTLLPPASAQQHHAAGQHDAHIGTVSFRVSCAPAVRQEFDRAVAMLHHMMYEESRELFAGIASRDSGCAMAHWGVAMTLFQPLWPTRPSAAERQRGWEAVQRAQRLGPGSDRERGLLAAAAAFYRDPGSDEWWPRIHRWAEAMASVYREYPDDVEVAAFYALARIAEGQVAEDRLAHNAEAARILLPIHERHPSHPGAIHYTIHANDVTGRADTSLDVVARYDDIAPSVPHALHMPTHIFVRLGEWPEVIEWNRKSAEAALRYPINGQVTHHYPHAQDYLLYAYLQRGDDAAARQVLEETLGRKPYLEHFVNGFHLAVMPARYAVERRDWKAAAAITPRTPASLAWDRYLWPEAIAWFARGLGAAHLGDRARAGEAEARMRALRERAEAQGERDFAAYIEIDRLILAGRLALGAGDTTGAIERLRAAAKLEGTVQKHPVTPGALMPPYEALGDLLLEVGRPAEAVKAYRASLEIWPGRYRSLLGAARASQASGDAAGAREHYRRLLEVVGDARTDRPGVAEARAAAGTRSG